MLASFVKKLKFLDEEKYPREKEEGPHNTSSSLGLVGHLATLLGSRHLGSHSSSRCRGYLWVPKHIYLWRKVVCLFCFVCTDEIHPTRQDASDCVLGLFGKLLTTSRGASAWFHDVWTCSAKVLKYWMISSLKIKLNPSWKNSKELECVFGVVGKNLDEQDLMEFIW